MCYPCVRTGVTHLSGPYTHVGGGGRPEPSVRPRALWGGHVDGPASAEFVYLPGRAGPVVDGQRYDEQQADGQGEPPEDPLETLA